MTKLKILSYQSRELFFFEQLIVAAKKLVSQNFRISRKYFRIFAKFRFVFASLIFKKFRKKVCEMRPKSFAFFHKTFCSLETLAVRHVCTVCTVRPCPVSAILSGPSFKDDRAVFTMVPLKSFTKKTLYFF